MDKLNPREMIKNKTKQKQRMWQEKKYKENQSKAKEQRKELKNEKNQ